MAMSFKKAAKKILEGNGGAMSAAEITEQALQQSLISTDGKTPSATMAAQIYTDILNNPDSDFVKVGAGRFALRKATKEPDGLQALAIHNRKITEQLRKHLHEIDPGAFEYLIAALLGKIGFENVEVVGGSGDGGIDLTANLTVGGVTNVKTEIQAKRYKANVAPKYIREMRGSAELTKRGLIITTSDFTREAVAEAELPNKMPVSLVNGDKLVYLMIEHGVGIKKHNVDVLSIDNDFLEDLTEDTGSRSIKDKRSFSLWPLPGGTNSYFETLLNFLTFVKAKNPSVNEAVAWFKKTYASVESDKTARGYVGVPRSMGLIDNIGNKLSLTNKGKALLSDPKPLNLRVVLEEEIIGVSEILEVLEKQSMTETEILEYLNASLNLKWETSAQPRFRLTWLVNAGAITKDPDSGRFSIKG